MLRQRVNEPLTIMIDLLFYARLAVSLRSILADILEVIGHLVHLVSLEIRYYHIYLVAATVVHAAEEHQLRELEGAAGWL